MIDRLTSINIYMQEFPVVVIIGPRQVGKTTLARQVASHHPDAVWLDMELPSDQQKLADMEAWLRAMRHRLVVVDEVQFLPAIFSALRPEVDADRRPGRFLLTGSANPLLLKGVSESLAGRAAYLELPPLTLPEVLPAHTLQMHWFRGGYPSALLAPSHDAYHRWAAQYIQSFVQRDLQAMFDLVLAPSTVQNLWQMLANNNGGILNIESFARALGVSGPTVKKYLTLLEGAFLLRSLPPWFVNANKRLVKSPKLYIRDSGLTHHFTGIAKPEDMPGHVAVGASWEGYVVEQIIKQLPAAFAPFFYRTHQGAEIDLLLVKNGKPLYAIEVKHSLAPVLSKGFYSAAAEVGATQLFVIYTGTDTYPGPSKATVCSLPLFLKQYLEHR
jgi:uncharacterized protein